ncbi:VOC family protein [Streptomyces sp. NBC_00094]|uniref:VOC family protein n=1 Tax=Streptomyces sp. NBC_00094 TaxID=2903620 RepID=UPI0022572D8C|nr:VOC family protein [Streptomyces sp. NBC_00094]MCX5390731.1 VOC family protein [Streptomyces sp. NBC_00094]
MSAIGTLTTHHVGLNVTDLERSLGFYGDVLGFEVLGEGKEGESRYAFLGQDGRLVLTLWQQAEGAYDSARPGLHHLAFEAESLAHVRAAETALTARGTSFAYEGVVAHREGAASGGIFFHDPDGTRLEISVPTGAESAEAPVGTAPTCGFF